MTIPILHTYRKMNWQHAGMSKDGLNYFSAWHR